MSRVGVGGAGREGARRVLGQSSCSVLSLSWCAKRVIHALYRDTCVTPFGVFGDLLRPSPLCYDI